MVRLGCPSVRYISGNEELSQTQLEVIPSNQTILLTGCVPGWAVRFFFGVGPPMLLFLDSSGFEKQDEPVFLSNVEFRRQRHLSCKQRRAINLVFRNEFAKLGKFWQMFLKCLLFSQNTANFVQNVHNIV